MRAASLGAVVLLGPMLSAGAASAQTVSLGQTGAMATGNTAAASPYGYFVGDENVYVHGIFNELEGRLNGQNAYFRWDGEAWAGTDENRLWIKSEGRQYGNGKLEDGDQEVLYDRPISRFYDVQAGIRYDLDSLPGRAWAAVGIQGLLPNFANMSLTFYARGDAHYAARLNAYYDLFLTQFLVAEPQIEVNAYTRTDRARMVGAGISDIDVGLRVRYEFTRKFAPYIGVADYHQFGGTAALARENGGHADDLRFLAGLWTWF